MKLRVMMGVAALGLLAGCDKGASDLQSDLDKWVKETRPGSHYEIGEVSNVEKLAAGTEYTFDVTVTDKDTGKVIHTHQMLVFNKDGDLSFPKDEKMSPLGFEQWLASAKAIATDPNYAKATVMGVNTSFISFCDTLKDDNPNTFSCKTTVHVTPPGATQPDNIPLTILMTWNGRDWDVSLPAPKLTDVWWASRSGRYLNFNTNGRLEIGEGSSFGQAHDVWRDGGNGTVLIQYPGQQHTLTGEASEAMGPVARCPIQLNAVTMRIVDCTYNRLIGTYHLAD